MLSKHRLVAKEHTEVGWSSAKFCSAIFSAKQLFEIGCGSQEDFLKMSFATLEHVGILACQIRTLLSHGGRYDIEKGCV